MKSTTLTATALVLMCCYFFISSSAAAPENQNINHLPLLPPSDDASERQKWFLDYVQQIADYPNLFDADALTKFLQSQFTTKHSETHYEKECDAPNSTSSNIRADATDYYTFDKNSWFKLMPGGIPHMHLAGDGIFHSKPQDLDDPRAGFYISKITTCGGRKKIKPEVKVNINFDNIPGFVCITQDQLQTLLPQVKRDNVTDGGVMYSYKTQPIEESGVLVSFWFPVFSMANECLIGASIQQDERYGIKAERVHKEFWNCLNTKHVNSGDPACGGGIPEIMNKE